MPTHWHVFPFPADRRSRERTSASTEKTRRSSPTPSSQRRTAAAATNRLRLRRIETSAEAIFATRPILRRRWSRFLFRWAHPLWERWRAVGAESGWDIGSGFEFSRICRVCCRTIDRASCRLGWWSRSSCRRLCSTFVVPMEVWWKIFLLGLTWKSFFYLFDSSDVLGNFLDVFLNVFVKIFNSAIRKISSTKYSY